MHRSVLRHGISRLLWHVQARSRKVEAQSKLEQLQRDIAELSSLSPDTVAAEEEVTQKLQEVGLHLYIKGGILQLPLIWQMFKKCLLWHLQVLDLETFLCGVQASSLQTMAWQRHSTSS